MILIKTLDPTLQDGELPFFKNSLKAVFSEKGLCRLSFQSGPAKENLGCPKLQKILSPLLAYLNGDLQSFLWPIDWSKLKGTAFQKKVWRALCEIPSGEVATYSEVAQAVGSPNAARAVGAACGQNPILLVIPCHRVVAQGHWGGYSGGGLEIKKTLLRLEGHHL